MSSSRLIGKVIDHARTTNPTDLLVLLVIADDDWGIHPTYPSIARIARRTRLSERSVTRALERLEQTGDLRIDRGAGRHGTHVYHVQGVTESHPLTEPRGVTQSPRGVTESHPRGDTVSPDSLSNSLIDSLISGSSNHTVVGVPAPAALSDDGDNDLAMTRPALAALRAATRELLARDPEGLRLIQTHVRECPRCPAKMADLTDAPDTTLEHLAEHVRAFGDDDAFEANKRRLEILLSKIEDGIFFGSDVLIPIEHHIRECRQCGLHYRLTTLLREGKPSHVAHALAFAEETVLKRRQYLIEGRKQMAKRQNDKDTVPPAWRNDYGIGTDFSIIETWPSAA